MIEIDSKEDLDKLLAENERLLVLFHASWCGFCRRFVPAFDCKTASFNGAQVIHVLLDDYDNELWDDYEIDAVPTVVYFEKGKIAKRLDGRFGLGLNEKQLSTWLQEFKT